MSSSFEAQIPGRRPRRPPTPRVFRSPVPLAVAYLSVAPRRLLLLVAQAARAQDAAAVEVQADAAEESEMAAAEPQSAPLGRRNAFRPVARESAYRANNGGRLSHVRKEPVSMGNASNAFPSPKTVRETAIECAWTTRNGPLSKCAATKHAKTAAAKASVLPDSPNAVQHHRARAASRNAR
jgi:hypothetical protein